MAVGQPRELLGNFCKRGLIVERFVCHFTQFVCRPCYKEIIIRFP